MMIIKFILFPGKFHFLRYILFFRNLLITKKFIIIIIIIILFYFIVVQYQFTFTWYDAVYYFL